MATPSATQNSNSYLIINRCGLIKQKKNEIPIVRMCRIPFHRDSAQNTLPNQFLYIYFSTLLLFTHLRKTNYMISTLPFISSATVMPKKQKKNRKKNNNNTEQIEMRSSKSKWSKDKTRNNNNAGATATRRTTEEQWIIPFLIIINAINC